MGNDEVLIQFQYDCCMEWRPATIEEVKAIVKEDLRACTNEQTATFARFAVAPYAAPILRHEKMETVVVVARNGNNVLYWEDVEGGFNTSPISEEGQIKEHWCDQDSLGTALPLRTNLSEQVPLDGR